MYVLDYLAGRYGPFENSNAPVSEYRLLCSGEVYNGAVLTADWRKSDATRNLLLRPCSLTVVSQPLDDYPQELSLCIHAPDLVERSGNFSLMFRPDDDIAQDLTALLSVFLRRLVTVSVKVRVIYPTNLPGQPPGPYDWPLPIAKSISRIAWKRRPVSIGYGVRRIEAVIDYNPPPVSVDPDRLQSKLVTVATIQYGEAYVLAARLYAQAMQVIEEWPDIAYQLLISSIETMANRALPDYSPPPAVMVETKAQVARRATELGIGPKNAEELAILACDGMSWTSRRFQKFLKDMTDETLWQPDGLFKIPEGFEPSPGEFDQVLKEICRGRGAAVHQGRAFGASVGLGSVPAVPVRAMQDFFTGGPRIPPVTWFERVVNLALNRYLDAAMRQTDQATRGQTEAQVESARLAEKERVLELISALPQNVQDSLRKLVNWTARFLGYAMINPYAPNGEWADGPETIAILKKMGIIEGEGNDLHGSSWLKDREIGEIVGEFVFGAEKNPFHGNELLLPRGWE